MSLEKKLDTILNKLEKIEQRLDNIENKFDKFETKLKELDRKLSKLETVCEEFEEVLMAKPEAEALEVLNAKINNLKNLIQNYEKKVTMKEPYDKRLNILIHGIKRGGQTTARGPHATREIISCGPPTLAKTLLIVLIKHVT